MGFNVGQTSGPTDSSGAPLPVADTEQRKFYTLYHKPSVVHPQYSDKKVVEYLTEYELAEFKRQGWEVVDEKLGKEPSKVKEIAGKIKDKTVEVASGCFSAAKTVAAKVGTSINESATTAKEKLDAAFSSMASLITGDDKTAKQVDTAPADPTQSQSLISKLNPLSTQENRINGQTMVRLQTPSIIKDITTSEYAKKLSDLTRSGYEFKREFCDKMPYPECALCKKSKTTLKLDANDLQNLLNGISSGLRALIDGHVALASQLLDCPGQMNAMLGNLGPLGSLLGSVAAKTMIGLQAAKGALDSFTNAVNFFKDTDFKGMLTRSMNQVLESASGLPKVFTKKFDDLMKSLDLAGEAWAKLTSSSSNARNGTSVHIGPDDLEVIRVKTERIGNIREASEMSKLAAEAVLSDLNYSDNSSKYKSSDSVVAEEGKSYYIKDESEKFIKIDVEPGKSLESIEATYGSIYEKEEDPLSGPTPVKCQMDDIVTEGFKYFSYDKDNDDYIDLEVKESEYGETVRTLADDRDVDDVYRLHDDSKPSYSSTSDTHADEDSQYYVLVDGKFVKVEVEPGGELPIGSQIFKKQPPYPSGLSDSSAGYSFTLPHLLPNGRLITVPVIMSASALRDAFYTPILVTETHMLASAISQIESLNMSLYEVKMSYLCDHLRNKSILPLDCKFERVNTILDTLPDD